MNYNNLQNYTTEEQIYSNDLNEILSKTPPRLFKLTLLAIAVCICILFVSAYFIKYNETTSTNFVMTATGEMNAKLTIIADKSNIQKLTKSKKAVIEYSGYSGGNEATRLITFDSIKIDPFYQLNDTLYHNLTQLISRAPDFNKIITKYRVTINIKNTPADASLSTTKETVGSIKFIVSETRLIYKFLNFRKK